MAAEGDVEVALGEPFGQTLAPLHHRDGVRVDGPAVNAPADLAGDEAADGSAHRIEFAHPIPAGLVAAVSDWACEPQPLVPLYLRRPDANTLAERGVR